MISKDDPAHHRQRMLVADRFTRRAMGDLESDVRSVVIDAIAGIGRADSCEVVDAVASRIPAIVTCRLLGWPDSHWRDVRSWSERLMRIDTMPTNPRHLADGVDAVTEIAALTDMSVAERRRCPADDLISRWSNGEIDGRPMTIDEINSELGLVIPGGAETTRTTLARALILFSERPDLWDDLAAHPESIPVAVEELLRWITPLNNMFRVAATDTQLDGINIREGERLALVYPSANRDEEVFTDPDEIDLGRSPNPHIAFGFGTHLCLGAHVARLTLRVVLEELTGRITDLRPVSAPRYEANVFVKAVEHFQLGFRHR
jgi:cytochrome P450 family 142 subfamily A polypeptide 1